MRSITDEILKIPRPDESEFRMFWNKWLNSDLGVAYRVFLEDKYDIQDPFSLPYPSYNKNAEEDEQLAQVLEDCLLIKEIREDREGFLEKMKDNNLSFTQVYQAFVLETSRLWYVLNPDMKTIRRIWYKGFKVFAQFLRDNEFSESDYGLLIKACGNWVSNGLMFYSNFFVQDTTRKIFKNETDRGWKNVFLLCEKDAAADELNPLADILGAMFVISGHGIPSMAACEKSLVLRQLQYIKNNHPEEKKIILAIVSDYDHAGVNGVAGGFVQQFKTFCEHLGLELVYNRVGLLPEHVPEHRLSPSFALYSPPLRGVVRCKECLETVYVCNNCGKGKKLKKHPKTCGKMDKDGEKCENNTFTVVEVGTKVPAKDSRTGFLRKDDRDLVKKDPSQITNFINQKECPSCGKINQELSLEANPWSRVFGVPYCVTHEECHSNNYLEFSDETKYLQDNSCVIERYGIELDALGASYYSESITNFIYKELGIDGVSEWSRKTQIPEEWQYDEVIDNLVDSVASENEVYTKIKNLIRDSERVLSELRNEKDSVTEELKDLLTERRGELLEEINWDDRQREWDESEEEWTEESIKEMHETHWKLVRHAIKIKQDYHDYYYGTLGFEKQQLTKKLKDTLNEEIDNDELDLPELDEESPYLAKKVRLIPEAIERTLKKCVKLFIKVGIDSEEHEILFEEDETELLESVVKELESEDSGE